MTKKTGTLFVIVGFVSFLIGLGSFDIYTLAFTFILGMVLLFVGFYKIVRSDKNELDSDKNG